MPSITVKLATRVLRSFRVEQVAGMFDVRLGGAECGREGESRRGGEEETILVGHELTAEVPGVDEAWTIGAIVGPSGSGKTTLARAAFGEAVHEAGEWPRERAIIDVVGGSVSGGETPIKEILRVLVGVGLGSVRTWLKPYHVLSGGERFRAEMARALLSRGNLTQGRKGAGEERGEFKVQGSRFKVGGPGLPVGEGTEGEKRGSCGVVVVDEFTSSLDRMVAKTTSAAVGRLVRSQGTGGMARLVVVTCHEDVLRWLAPDWVVEFWSADCGMRIERGAESGKGGDGERRARLRWWPHERVEWDLEMRRVPQAMWERFAGEHYLSGGLAASATCYGAWERGEFKVQGSKFKVGLMTGSVAGNYREADASRSPVAFCAVVATLGHARTKHVTRLVVQPGFQGLGIGSWLLERVAECEAGKGNRVTITASHPAVLAHCSQSPNWRYVGVKKTGSTRQKFGEREIRSSRGRAVAGFEWQGARGQGAGGRGQGTGDRE